MKIKLSNFILPVRLFISLWLRRNLCHNLNLHHNLSPFLLLLPGTRTIRWAGFLLLSFPLHAQVVIKEKVEIDFSDRLVIQLLKSSGEQTPFYGDVTIGFNCSAGGANTKVILRVGDASKRIYPGWEPECRPGYPWYCNGWMYDALENQPAFSPVSIEMEACKTITGNPNDTQWHTIPVLIGDIVNNSAPVYAYINSPDTPAVWPHIANLGFVEKIPPDCNIPYDNCSTNLYLPEIVLNEVPNGYSGRNICNDVARPLEGINVFWTDSLYSFNLDVCYNADRQKLWFNIADNHTLKINYSYAICEDNLPPGKNCQFINNWTEMINTLTCDQYEAILHATYFYGSSATPCYFFRNIIYAHEMEHVNDYQEAINIANTNFYEGLDSINVTCENFENPDSARNFLQGAVESRFRNFKDMSLNNFINIQARGRLRSGSYEQDVQNRHSVRAIINSQIDAVNVSYGCTIPHLYE